MKKRVKKLVLAKETVQSLSVGDLVKAAGASYGAASCGGNPVPSEGLCNPTGSCDCPPY